jgi:hypothetical protein
MNGMKMPVYWLVTFLFNFGIYAFTVVVFFLFGAYAVGLQFFYQTGFGILFTLLVGWGYAQIALSFFFQAFISKARTATVLGYLVSIWMVLWGCVLNLVVYTHPRVMPSAFYIYPQFALTRSLYILSMACGNYRCVETWDEVDT